MRQVVVQDRKEETPYFRVSASKERSAPRPLVLIFFLAIVSVGAISWMAFNYDGFVQAEDVVPERPQGEFAVLASQTASATFSPEPSSSATSSTTPIPLIDQSSFPFGAVIYDAYSKGYRHLWAMVPGEPTSTRLTSGNWNDREPVVSPDGKSIAFSSHRDGNWEIYLLDLQTGATRRVTATLGFEGNPAWSPDGQWLAYEAYADGNFDIWLLPIDGLSEPFRLTTDPGYDLAPAWSPDGRQIAFVSDREDGFDLYLADLDDSESRFRRLTVTPGMDESGPLFNHAGDTIAYGARDGEQSQLYLLEPGADAPIGTLVGSGANPIWSPDDHSLAVIQSAATESHIVSYNVGARGIPPLGVVVQGEIHGMDWLSENMILEGFAPQGSVSEAQALYTTEIETPVAQGRYSLVPIVDLSAPNPYLSDLANEAYVALRERMVQEVAWDFLANLDYAYVGLNDPLPPGFAYNDWLYTGRAFAISEAIVRAGWVEVLREDIAGQTFWKIFVRARYQDGSMGEPLRQVPWDFSARLQGDPMAYDHGGRYASEIPHGYYVNFTGIAAAYGFARQPALANWRTYYPGARFKEFALMDDLEWEEAMLELYPPSAILTPTPFLTPTTTPTRTPWPTITPWWRVPTETPSPTMTLKSTSEP